MDSAWANGYRDLSHPDAETAWLEALMGEYAAQLYRLARYITRNSADAEEVLQDVFFTVYRKIDTFEGRAALGTWLHRICVNVAVNRTRRNRDGLQVPLADLAEFRRLRRRADCASREWSPDYALLTEEARAVLNTEVAALPDRYRVVLLLREVEERPSADVAGMLQESEACVKSRLHRARVVLRKRLASYFPDRQRRANLMAGEHPRRRRDAARPPLTVAERPHGMEPAPASVAARRGRSA